VAFLFFPYPVGVPAPLFLISLICSFPFFTISIAKPLLLFPEPSAAVSALKKSAPAQYSKRPPRLKYDLAIVIKMGQSLGSYAGSFSA
jgi:hypothetical protein